MPTRDLRSDPDSRQIIHIRQAGLPRQLLSIHYFHLSRATAGLGAEKVTCPPGTGGTFPILSTAMEIPMRAPFPSWFAASAALPVLLLVACGGGSTTGTVDNSGTHGSLVQNPPPRLASLSATDFNAELASLPGGSSLLQLATGSATGSLPFGVDVYYFTYATKGGAGEACTATGALMVPTGANGSLGARPIVLYAHGTETYQPYNMANVAAPYDNRIPMVAALFAGNGFIVVAPNYAGYDASNLPYHPYLNGLQQSGDMMDALAAARTALKSGNLFASAPTDNGQLFITGYSQGGYVAMATQKAIEAAGGTVTACAPGSGPYALGAFGDVMFGGEPDFGASEFTPLVFSSYYNSYKSNETIGNIFPATGGPADAIEAAYAATVDTIAPGQVDLDTLILGGKWPLAAFNGTVPSATDIAAGLAMDGLTNAPGASALAAGLAEEFPGISPVSGNPLFAIGFSSGSAPNLIKNSYRAAYVADAAVNPDGAVPTVTTGLPAATSYFPLRKALAYNDLRGWAPKAPILMMGGHNDPEVFFSVNTQLMASLWAGITAPKGFVEPYYDVDPGLNMTTIAQAAGQAFGVDVGKGIVDPATFAADINAAVVAYLGTITPGDPLQAGFLQGVAQAVATVITPANLSGMISQATGTGAPFTTAQIGPVATGIATAIGTATDTIIIEAYHSDLVAPFAHAAALQFFSKFLAI